MSYRAGKTILASTIAKKYSEELTSVTSKMITKPKLVGLLGNQDPAAKTYAEWTARTCESVGFQYELIQCPKENLEDEIYKCNQDDAVNGIMVYFPVYNDGQDQYLQQCVSIEKDVEGLNFKYVSNMYHNIRYLDAPENTKKSILPCTPLAMVKILEYLGVYNTLLPYGNRLFGKTITIVNRSEIVGRPLAALLANDGATVYSVDINNVQKFERGDGLQLKSHRVVDTEFELKDVAPKSDVIITGVPSSSYKFPLEYVKDGAVVINFSSEKNFDDKIKDIASLYVPSIGKVTIAMLLRNLLRLMNNKKPHSVEEI
ncbi:BA75_01633T0 [Komagataella pastoris]|uniref:Methylenetetrahydrofolate dehydrogenase [NAD(+)] n=1 Tax=Komagataella pastoris TaxID=4922 RepID=A0A1B2J852_PICPA|nr:BA75_01633T0 [Komagataella pastoris]